MTLFTLTIFLVGIWSLAFYASYTLRHDLEQALGEQQFSTVSIIAADINAALDDRLRALEKVAALITPAILGNAKSVQKMLEERPVLGMMFNAGTNVTRLDGVVIADLPISMGRIGINYSDRNHVAGALKGKSTIGNPLMGKMVKAPIVPIAVPILDHGKVIGTLTGITNLGTPNFLSKITDNSYGKMGGYLLAAPQHKLFVTGTDKSRIMQPLPAPGVNPMLDRYMQGFDGFGVALNSRGIEELSAAKQIPVAGWFVVAVLPTKEAFAPIRAMQKSMLLATIFLTLLAGGLAWWMLKRQLAPVFATIKTLATLADSGQPLQLLPITRQDEIGELIGGFNHLLEALGQRGEALKESEARFRNVLQDVQSVSVQGYSPDGTTQYWNQASERLYGYTTQEAIGQNLVDLIIPPEMRGDVQNVMQQMAKTGQPIPASELSLMRKDGARVSVYSSHTIIHVPGRAQELFCIDIDLTDYKRAERALRESEKQYRTLFEAIADTVFLIDQETGSLLDVNPTATRMYGFNREEFLQMTAMDVSAESEKTASAVSKPVSSIPLRYHRHKDGTVFPVELTASIFELQGRKTIIATARDITERKQVEEEKRDLEERLHNAEKMEALGQLAGGVAHDLNNVLGILSGYSELLLEEIPEGSPSRIYVDKILQSTKKGAAIIQDLLTLARRGVTSSDIINLNTIVSDFLETPVFDKFKDYHPHVTFRSESDENLLNIKGSSVHLEKALMNLVSNAAEAITKPGEVTIRTENRHLNKPIRGYDEVKEGDYAILTVSDTGMGIPAENIQKIFEPFYTKKKMGKSGTGLGLAIVWGTVKDHNGYLDVLTEVGKGTTFTLYFPVTREELTSPEAEVPIEQYMGQGASVLVVDDIFEQREIASKLLTKLGYDVHLVSSGEEAVEYLKRNKADILVLDMIMTPGIDGLETYKKVLEINPKQKAILVSGFTETDRAREAQKLGAGAYLKKPYVMKKIGVAIRDELNRK